MIAIIDTRTDKKICEGLSCRGFELIRLQPADLQPPVASHPDMLIFIGSGALICHRTYYEQNKDTVGRIANAGGLSLILSDEKMAPDYPHDVLFNALQIGQILICNTRSTSREILRLCEKNNIEAVHVNQGYSRCSTLKVDDGAIVTADPSIARACREHGLEVLEISAGGISLPGYDYGFIGGASGVCGDTVYFMGDIGSHPDGEKICTFIRRRGKNAICLSDGRPCDFGGIIFI